ASRDFSFRPESVDDAAVNIRAHHMDLYPGSELHCRGATVYVGGKQVLSLPFYRLPLNPNDPSADRYVSYNSYSGLGINVPVYYMLNQHGMGAIRLTHEQRAG